MKRFLLCQLALGLGLQALIAQTPAPIGEPTEKLGQLTLELVNLDNSPYQGPVVFKDAQGKAWSAKTNEQGIAENVLLPIGQTYHVHTGPHTASTPVEIPNQGFAFVQTGMYRHDGIWLNFNYKDLENKPLSNEKLEIRSLQTGQIYEALTDKKGKAALSLPFDSAFVLSLPYQPDCMRLRPNPKKGPVQEITQNYRWIGSQAMEAKLREQDSILKAELAAIKAQKQTLLSNIKKLPQAQNAEQYNQYDSEILFYQCSDDWNWWNQLCAAKAQAYTQVLPRRDTFVNLRKRGGIAGLQRLRKQYPKMLTVVNTGYGTDGYWQDPLLDHLMSGTNNRFLLYRPQADNPRLNTYTWLDLAANDAQQLGKTLESIIKIQNRGQFGQSNDMQAVLEAASKAKADEEIVLITRCEYVDLDFKALEALKKLKKPVHVVLWGFREMQGGLYQVRNPDHFNVYRQVDIAPQLLAIVYATKGSLRTNTRDFSTEIHKLQPGQRIVLNNESYLLQKDGSFVLEHMQGRK